MDDKHFEEFNKAPDEYLEKTLKGFYEYSNKYPTDLYLGKREYESLCMAFQPAKGTVVDDGTMTKEGLKNLQDHLDKSASEPFLIREFMSSVGLVNVVEVVRDSYYAIHSLQK